MLSILADLVIWIHFLWIGFLILGFPVVLYLNRRGWRLLHAGALMAALIMQIAGIWCPLTILEGWLKDRGGPASYPGDFIPRMLEQLIYVDDDVLAVVPWLTVLYTGLVVLSFWLRPLKRNTRQAD